MQHRDDDRESIWGIASKDRAWFQALTLVGGVGLSIMTVYLELAYRPADTTPNMVARSVIVGIGASFVASGFVAWGILQAKEMAMAAADLIRGFTEKRKQKWAAEAEEQRRKWAAEARQARDAAYEQGSRDTREQIQREVREKLGDESYFRLFGNGASNQPPTGE